MLKTDLDAGKPIQYAGFGQGGGHTWVCDGYDNSNYFHMNWGWGGVYDGYFSLDNLSPGTGGAGGGSGSFTSGQQALMGIEPPEGGNPGGSTLDLRAYSDIQVSPNPINFANAFDVTVAIGNYDDTNFSGSLAAALFNSEGDFIDFVEELNSISLEVGYYNTYTFHTDGLLATPGDYFIGIYYKMSGGEYNIIGPGDYNNYVSTSIVGPANTMQLYSTISITPQTITSGQAFQLVFDIANFGSSTFVGDVSADLYDSEGNYVSELAILNIQLEGGYYGTITFDCPGVNVDPGSYLLAIWDLPSGGNWSLVGSDEYPNPIMVQIAAQQVQPDMYESNDLEAQAYGLSYSGNTQETVNTNGSNIHEGNDMDFYKIDLPAGSQYKFIARAHDSYNSGNGQSYTDDVLWAYKAGGDWSEAFDDVMNGFFVVNGGQTVYFVVSNYYQGSTGSYLLEMQIEKGSFGIDELNDPGFITLYPNPAKDCIYLSAKNWHDLELPLDIELVNIQGQSVYQIKNVMPDANDLKLNLPDLPSGQYYLRLNGQQFYLDEKVLIAE
ncbi:MAG: C10 family peptidase [Bacteroidales bacterium]